MRTLAAAAYLTLCLILITSAAPDISTVSIVQLDSGGELRGTPVTPGVAGEAEIVVLETASGVRIGLERGSITSTASETDAVLAYRQRAPHTPATVAAHWELAQWCQENKLREEMMLHLLRVIDIAPDHAEARQQLGQQKIDGVWTTRDEALTAKGYVKDRGRWRYQQEVDLEAAKQQTQTTAKEWTRRIERLRARILSGDLTGKLELQNLGDPDAVAPLSQLLTKEPTPEMRRLYVIALGQIDSAAAAMTIAIHVLNPNEPSADVRQTGIEQLRGNDLAQELVLTQFRAQLRASSGNRVNEIALCLEQLGNPDAVPDLIAMLTSKQTRTAQIGTGGPSYNTQTGGFGAGATTVSREEIVPNPGVRQALTRLTQKDFGYDIAAWQRWYAAAHRVFVPNLRRTY